MTIARWLIPFGLVGIVGCRTEEPTQVVVDNDYAPVADGGDPATEMTVFKVWWVTSLLPEAVVPGGEGQMERTVPNADFAYAVLAPGWDPTSTARPTRFIAARSVVTLRAARGDTLHVHISDDTFAGNCAAGRPLAQADADFITQRIFPSEYAGVFYDAATCSMTSSPNDAGALATPASLAEASTESASDGDGIGGD